MEADRSTALTGHPAPRMARQARSDRRGTEVTDRGVLAEILRPGNAGSNTAADHIEVTDLALAQPSSAARPADMVPADTGGANHALMEGSHGCRL
jgi:hypothetical protein